MPTIAVNGFSMHYLEGGAGEDVVFVHGGFASMDRTLREPHEYEWDDWEREFAREFHFIDYHRRGCELSSCPDVGFDPATQASDLSSLLEYLGLEVAHVVGSSAGGPISVEFASTYPERTKSLVLVGSSLDLFRPVAQDDEALRIIGQQLRLLDELGPEETFRRRPPGIETSLEPLYMKPEMEQRGELGEYLQREAALTAKARARSLTERARYYAAELRNIQTYMQWDGSARAAAVKAPTLVLHGEYDRAVPVSWGRELSDAIPTARFCMIPKASHGLLWRSTDARRAAIRFIHERSAPPVG